MEQRDERLLKKAYKRVKFRRHLFMYIVMNSFFWILWFLNHGNHEGAPWPIWPMLGWGIGLAFSYFNAYMDDKDSAVDAEYEKLKQNEK